VERKASKEFRGKCIWMSILVRDEVENQICGHSSQQSECVCVREMQVRGREGVSCFKSQQ
jgi:hypothetical protein